STIKAAGAGHAAGIGLIPTRVIVLTEGVTNMMLLRKVKPLIAVLLGFLVCAGGGLVVIRSLAAGERPLTAEKKGTREAPGRQAAPTQNILLNSSFEDGDKTPAHWSEGAEIDGVEYIWDRKTGQKGTSSLCLRKTANRYFPIAQWYQVVDRTGNQSALK